jgi:hypothetical protein
MYSKIPGSQAVSDTTWSLPCNSTFQITMTVNGTSFTIRERDTIQKKSNGTCFGVVTGGAQNISQVGAPNAINSIPFPVPTSPDLSIISTRMTALDVCHSVYGEGGSDTVDDYYEPNASMS